MGINSVGRTENRFAKGVQMLDEARSTEAAGDDYVEFLSTGAAAAGAYHCSSCGYGVTVHARLPLCPMCAGTTWEPRAWTPIYRAGLQ